MAEIGPSVTKYEVGFSRRWVNRNLTMIRSSLAKCWWCPNQLSQSLEIQWGIEAQPWDCEFLSGELRNNRKRKKISWNSSGKAVNGIARALTPNAPLAVVAGSTVLGKPVAVNALSPASLMKARLTKVTAMPVDPRWLNCLFIMSPYLLIQVVTFNYVRPASIVRRMRWKVVMNFKRGVRTLQAFNAKVEEFNAQSEYCSATAFIVVIVDELADHDGCQREVEDAINCLDRRHVPPVSIDLQPSPSVDVWFDQGQCPIFVSRLRFSIRTDSCNDFGYEMSRKLLRGDMPKTDWWKSSSSSSPLSRWRCRTVKLYQGSVMRDMMRWIQWWGFWKWSCTSDGESGGIRFWRSWL